MFNALHRRTTSRSYVFVWALSVIALSPSLSCALTVTDMAPAPGSTLTAVPTTLTVTLSQPADGASVNASTVRLVRAGPDGVFGTADDIAIVPAGISTNGNQINVDLTGVKLPNDSYQLTLGGSQSGPSGNTNYTVGTQPVGIAIGDIDGDGFPDLVVSNVQSQDVSILLGNGAGQFAPAVSFPIGAYGWSVALADFNGDGKLDIVVANGIYNTCKVLLNSSMPGALAFSAPTSFTTGSNVSFVVAKDINGDGKPDLVVANQASNSIGVFINTTPALAATPTFSTMYSFATQQIPRAVSVADVNGDGLLDVAVANYASNSISVLLNTTPALSAVPSFTAATNFTVGQNPYHVELADLNGDGKPDLIEPNYNDNTVGVLFNTTPTNGNTPTFAAPVYLNVGAHPHFAFAGDLDGDGRPDIISNNHTSNTVQVSYNQTPNLGSTPIFGSPISVTVGASPGAIRIGDITGHGDVGAIVANEGGAPSVVSVLTNFNPLQIKDASGNRLDGAFTGTFPSGDNTFANFTASFTISVPPLQVTALSPAPNAVLSAPPASIVVTMSKAIDPATVNAASVELRGAGPDGIFGTADDLKIAPHGVSGSGPTATVDLTGVKLPNDVYQLTLHAARKSALVFTGTQLAAIPDQAIYQVPDFTVEAWIRCDAIPTQDEELFFHGDDRSGYDPFSLKLVSGGQLAFRVDTQDGASYQATAPAAVPLGVWVHAAGTFDSATKAVRVFVNGQLAASTTASDLPIEILSSTNPGLAFGNLQYLGAHGLQGFQGAIREARLWNVAHSQTQISATLNQPLTGSEAGLLGYWPLDEGAGQLIPDHSINNNTGTLGMNAAVSADDPSWNSVSVQPISDLIGNPLDGKFNGTFPSGDNTFADFIATFTLSAPQLQVTALSPAPNAVLTAPPASVVVTLSKAIDPATVGAGTVRLIGAGPDNQFGTADDITITPTNLIVNTTTIALDLSGVSMPAGKYQIVLSKAGTPAGLVAQWSFDESSGTIAHDSSGHGHDGTLINNPVWTAGKIRGGLKFNGTNYVEVPYASELNSNAFTISAWARLDSNASNFGSVVSSRDNNPTKGYILYAASIVGDWEFWTGKSLFNDPYWNELFGNPIALNQYTHLTGIYDGSAMRFYQDGVQVAASPAPFTANTSRPLRIGAGATEQSPTYFFNGIIDEVCVFNRALNSQEIALLSNPSGITDLNGNLLDGEFSGTFPSGDSIPGGDFIAGFRIDNPPVASVQALTLHSGASQPVTLSASDADGDPLTYSIVTPPAHGTLSGTPPNLSYFSFGYAGLDSFSFKANDGFSDGNTATVALNLANAAPVASDLALSTHSGTNVAVTLQASDADGDVLLYTLVTPPVHGSISGTLPFLFYTPSSPFSGVDTLTFKVNDLVADSNLATVTIQVNNQAPSVSASGSPTILLEGQSVSFASAASDPDQDALTWRWDFGDGTTSTEVNPVHVYAVAGVYSATVTVTDIADAQAVSTPITIHVFHDSDRPTARFVSNVLNGYVGQPVGFDATLSTDPRNTIVSYVWDFGDGSPQGTGQAIARVYTQTGTYTVTLTVTDGDGLSDTTTLTMVVLPADQAGLFLGTFAYKVNWNRAAANADSLSLTANLNAGDGNFSGAQTMALTLVGQTFTGTSGAKQTLLKGVGGAVAKFQIKPAKKGSPKGQLFVAVSVKHATLGKAFALAGAIGTKTAAVAIPIRLSIGKSSFAAAINSQFRFGSNGAKASGGGTGPK